MLVGVGVDDRPAEPGEVSGDGGGEERFALAALGVKPPPDVVQALVCAFQAVAIMTAGWSCWRVLSGGPIVGGRR